MVVSCGSNRRPSRRGSNRLLRHARAGRGDAEAGAGGRARLGRRARGRGGRARAGVRELACPYDAIQSPYPWDALEFIGAVILEGDPGASDEVLDRAGDEDFAWPAL